MKDELFERESEEKYIVYWCKLCKARADFPKEADYPEIIRAWRMEHIFQHILEELVAIRNTVTRMEGSL